MAAFSYSGDVWIYSLRSGSYHDQYQDALRTLRALKRVKSEPEQKGKKESNVSLLDRMCSIKEIEL